MATNVTLIVLPSMTFLERKGLWLNLSTHPPFDVAEFRKKVDNPLRGFMSKLVKHPVKDPRTFLRKIGRQQYEKYVPPPLKTELQKAAATADGDDVPILRIHTPINWIPWELMYDGTDFLGLRFQVARVPMGSTAPEIDNDESRTVSRIYHLLGAHLLNDDDDLFDKWKTTFSDRFAAGAEELRFPADDAGGQDYPCLTDLEMAKDPDIVHITCHGGMVDDNHKTYWTLDHTNIMIEEYRITEGDVRYLGTSSTFFKHTKPLVFGNACASVMAGNDDQDATNTGSLMHGFGEAFFSQGAIGFIGTFVPISKKMSIEFACEFYQRLLGEGLPIGKALWATKKHFNDLPQNDPSWLFYCLYGPPETHFKIGP
jgi:hypothetical protein